MSSRGRSMRQPPFFDLATARTFMEQFGGEVLQSEDKAGGGEYCEVARASARCGVDLSRPGESCANWATPAA